MSFNDLLPGGRRSPASLSSSSTSPKAALQETKATPPHRRNKAFMSKQSSNPDTTPVNLTQTVSASPSPDKMSRRQPITNGPPMPTPRHPMTVSRRGNHNPLELRVYLEKVPRSWTTWDLYRFFESYGTPSRIEIYERRTRDARAVVMFRPTPQDISWVGRHLPIYDPEGYQRVIETRNDTRGPFWYPSPNVARQLPERVTVPLENIGFGVMQDEDQMLVLYTAGPATTIQGGQVQVSMDLQHKEVHLSFPIEHQSLETGNTFERQFKLRFTPAQIREAFLLCEDGSSATIVVSIDTPPLAYRKTTNVQGTHDSQATLWDDRKTWFRQTDIDVNPRGRQSPIQLRKSNCVVDIGRWLTYRLQFSSLELQTPAFKDLAQALTDHNVNIVHEKKVTFDYADAEALWDWAGSQRATDLGGSMSSIHEMVDEDIRLPFPLQYQLEVCLSLGILHECNLDKAFLQRLASMEQSRAIKVLEKASDDKKRYFDPAGVLRLQNRVSTVEKKPPGYCTKIPSVTITPTTMYFSTPVLETSNRVIRHYQRHQDRFLRVRFTDERHLGKLFSTDDSSLNELYSRVKRTMTHGIKIGDRHYEFLAFGNSQFRDHGAYFFASATDDTTAAMIRDWMGDFTSIQVVAKYVSRLGQCFSTTRAIPHTVKIEEIPDVERNGYCFTDGVGKISPFLAQMIAHHYGLPSSEHDYPSVFQFRLAGCKGVLAVDPALKGMTVQIRPSQNKFPAKFHGLEICRISQYSSASLNVQIILVLSALGVPDDVFLSKLRSMLVELQEAMANEQKALELLQKNIDYNQTTIALACMIFDGFMETQEPFMLSCLRLWRSWSLKYLKEKARIFVEQGTFPLGATDECGILKGHFENADVQHDKGALPDEAALSDKATPSDETYLPEIFLQIPDPENAGSYKAVEGVCILARNPSLHPGDIRVVRAVDKKELYHYKNCVVLPQTGDRDLANMCSGGDLDGDDYLVIWDKDLVPPEWNHAPMDYTSPDPVMAEGPVTVDDMTSFFVQHIKNDNLSRIAVSHRYWADQLLDGVKDPKCVELAKLHSKAVDYCKTGVPATVSPGLRVQRWPHWSEQKNKAQSKIYHSRKVIGRLYDEVKKEPFHAAWDMPFDSRILTACVPSDQMLKDAKEVKQVYDNAIRRIMTQHGIRTEFEVYTTFVLDHHQAISDYKFAETMGEITVALKQEHQDLCYVKAGTDPQNKSWELMKPFIVAMYQVTADEIAEALAENKLTKQIGGIEVPLRALTFESMPLMSFPWLFASELGRIATKGNTATHLKATPKPTIPSKSAKATKIDLLGDNFVLPDLPEVNTSTGVVHEGELLELFSGVPAIAREQDLGHQPVAKKPENIDPDIVVSAAPDIAVQKSSPLPKPADLPLAEGHDVSGFRPGPVEGGDGFTNARSLNEKSFEENRRLASREQNLSEGHSGGENVEEEFDEGEVEFDGQKTEGSFGEAKQNPLDKLAELIYASESSL